MGLKAPEGYSYVVEDFNRSYFAVWIVNHRKFSYTDKQPKSIHSFVHKKTKNVHAPINSTKPGDVVNEWTKYTAMPIKLNPLMLALSS